MIDGRIATSSPPCPGLLFRAGMIAFLRSLQVASLMWGYAGIGVIEIEADGDPLPYAVTPLEVVQDIGYTGNTLEFASDGSYCFPVPAGGELSVTVTDLKTNEQITQFTLQSPPPDQPLQLPPLSNDKEPPTLVTTTVDLNGVDSSLGLYVRFSESMDASNLRDGLKLRDGSGRLVEGEIRISEQNRLAVFVPKYPLALGETFRFEFSGITDISGNELSASEPLLFESFKPVRIGDIEGIEALRDLQIHEVADGDETKTFVVASSRRYQTTNSGPCCRAQVVAIDVTNPQNPERTGEFTPGRGDQRSLGVVPDAIVPSEQGFYAGPLALSLFFQLTRGQNGVSMFGITPEGGLEFVSQRILSVQPDSIDQFSRFGTLKQLGFAKRLATLQTDSGPTAYVALSEIGLVGFEIEEPWWWVPFDQWNTGRKEPKVVNGDFIEVATTRTKVWAVERNVERTRNTLRSFSPSLSPLGGDLGLPGEPWSLHIATGFPIDANDDGQIDSSELRDLAFLGLSFKAATPRLLVVDVTGQVPFVVTDMRLGGAATDLVRSIDVDPVALRAAVVAGGNVLLVDLSAPDAAPVDRDSDGRDDRVVWAQPLPGVEVARIDANRALLYVGLTNGFGVIPGTSPPQQEHFGSLEIWRLSVGLRITNVKVSETAINETFAARLYTDEPELEIDHWDSFVTYPLAAAPFGVHPPSVTVSASFRGGVASDVKWRVVEASLPTAPADVLPGQQENKLEFLPWSKQIAFGSEKENQPLAYKVSVSATIDGKVHTDCVIVAQSRRDTLWQEYRDHQTKFQPSRLDQIHAPSIAAFNTGNYKGSKSVPLLWLSDSCPNQGPLVSRGSDNGSLIVEDTPANLGSLIEGINSKLALLLVNDVQEVDEQTGPAGEDGVLFTEDDITPETIVVSPGSRLSLAGSIGSTDPQGDDRCDRCLDAAGRPTACPWPWPQQSSQSPNVFCVGAVRAGPDRTVQTVANNRRNTLRVDVREAISSVYRNPQKHKQVYVDLGKPNAAATKTSVHLQGAAVDISPRRLNVPGMSTAHLTCAIEQAARDHLGLPADNLSTRKLNLVGEVREAFADKAGVPVPCDMTDGSGALIPDHVHISKAIRP
jgi:hypothetical protein